MSEEHHACPNCGARLGPKFMGVFFVRPDGCRLWAHDRNVRTRDALGNGEGSLEDEFARGIRTPWTSGEHKRTALAHLDGELLAFAKSLPYVRVEGES